MKDLINFGFNTPAADVLPAGPGVTPAAPPAATPGAGAPPSASPSATPGGPGAAPRMYSSEEVSKTVQERLAREQEKYAPYKNLGEPKVVSERLARLDKLEKMLQGEQPAPHSAEEKELRDLISKLGFSDTGKVSDVEKRIEAMERQEQQRHISAGSAQIGSLAEEKFGKLDAEALALVEGAVSASIGSDPEALKAFFGGDREVVGKHFAKVFEKQFDPFLKSAAARYAGGKATDKREVPPPTPKGGVQAPVATDRKLNADERRDAAWARMQELESRG